jgi:hypothetical protein
MALWNIPGLSADFAQLADKMAFDVNVWATRQGFYDGPTDEEVSAKITAIENDAGVKFPPEFHGALYRHFGRYESNPAESVALMHSELSEALENLRRPEARDKHFPDEDPVGLEMADAVIRIFNYCGYHKIPIGDLIIKKCRYNDTRPRMNGRKEF